MKGDIDYMGQRNTNCRVEDENGELQSANLVSVINIPDVLLLHPTERPITLVFGDDGGLENGIALRIKRGNNFTNLGNAKSNAELLTFGDIIPFQAFQSTQTEGFKFVLDYAGQENRGVAIRLAPDESIQILVQDDLSSLLQMRAVAIGHISRC